MVWHLSSMDAMLLALCLFFVAGIWGTYIIAVVCEIASRISKRIFLDKFAMQMARLGTLTHCAVWLAVGCGAFLIFSDYPSLLKNMHGANTPLLLGTIALGLVGTALLSIYFGTWKIFKKKQKIVHIALGLLGILCLKPLFWIPIIALRAQAMSTEKLHVSTLPGLDSLLWPLGVQWAILSVSLSAVLGMGYLLLRRNRDDFGRDYYKYAFPVCAKWALFPIPALMATCAWASMLFVPQLDFGDSLPLVASLGIRGISLFFVAIIWIVIIRSKTPLRLKGAIVASIVLTWLFLFGTINALWEILGTYSGIFIPQTSIHELLIALGWII